MLEQSPKWTVLTYKYRLLDPIDWDDDCDEQLFLQRKLWNKLVEIERAHSDRYHHVLAVDAAYAAISGQLEMSRAEQADLRSERRKLRQKAGRNVDTPTLDDRLRALSREIQQLVSASKEAASCARARGDARALLARLELDRAKAAKQARTQSGLWWGNYNAIWRSYQVARSQAIKSKKQLQFHGHCSEGRFTVQIIRGASADDLLTDRCSHVSIDPTLFPVPWRAHKPARTPRRSMRGRTIGAGPTYIGKPRPRLQITIYTRGLTRDARRIVSFPLIYDRPLPHDARVQEVIVRRQRVGKRMRYHASFILRFPYAPPTAPRCADRCGINLGFRLRPDGSLRVAVLASASGSQEFALPAQWMRGMDRVEAIQQYRDTRRNDVVAALRDQWPNRPSGTPKDLSERVDTLLLGRRYTAARLALAVLTWRQYPGYWPIMYEQLEAWRSKDARLWDIEGNKREHLRMQRREQYRRIARHISYSYGYINLGNAGLANISLLEQPNGDGNPLHQHARRNRMRAAASEFRTELRHQAHKAGSIVMEVLGSVTRRCFHCQALCAVGENLVHCCETCGAVWDQDENAGQNILHAEPEIIGSTSPIGGPAS